MDISKKANALTLPIVRLAITTGAFGLALVGFVHKMKSSVKGTGTALV